MGLNTKEWKPFCREPICQWERIFVAKLFVLIYGYSMISWSKTLFDFKPVFPFYNFWKSGKQKVCLCFRVGIKKFAYVLG